MLGPQFGEFPVWIPPSSTSYGGKKAVLNVRRYEEMLVYCQPVFYRIEPSQPYHVILDAMPSCALPSRAKQANTHMISPEPTGGRLTWLEGTMTCLPIMIHKKLGAGLEFVHKSVSEPEALAVAKPSTITYRRQPAGAEP